MASNGVVEKDLNLAIALKVREQLTMLGFSVVMTRETDNSLEDDPGQTIRERKVSDMHNREEMAKQLGENTLFLSIHQNKYTASSSWGTQIFYGRHAEESRSLAEFLQDFLCTQLQPENKRKIKEGTEDIYLLYHLTCPAVLVECGFLSNGQDLENLTDPEYQSRYAFVLAMGLLQYYTQYAGPSEAIEADMEFGAAETENAGDGYIS